MAIRTIPVDSLEPSFVDAFASGDGAIWLGAGVSAAWTYDDDGTPREPGVLPAGALINRLLGRALKENVRGEDLMDAGSRFVRAYGRAALDNIIRSWYVAEGVPAPRFYELLAELPDEVATFITTNYDPFTERSLSARRPVVVVKERGLDLRRAARPTVLKVHGDACEPSECVLTTRDYDIWENDNLLLRGAIAEIFSHKTVVMVGYRARDQHFRKTLNSVAQLIRRAEGEVAPLYVVMPNPDPDDFAVFEEHGLEVILIDATGEVFLEKLLDALRMHRRTRVLARINDLIEAPEVWALRNDIRNLRRREADAADKRRIGELREQLAAALQARSRPNDAIRERASALEDFRSAGADDNELARMAVALFEHVLQERLDPAAVQWEAQQCMANRRYDEADVALRIRLFRSAGLVLARNGWAEATERMANRAEAIAAQSEATARSQTETVAVLRAEAALLEENFGEAAEFWRVAADAAETPESASEFGIRAALCRGLTGHIDGAVDALRGLETTAATRALHRRATGWLLALAGRTEEAADTFRAAAQASLELEEVGFTVAALRNATWAEGQGTKLTLWEEADLQRAYRVERMETARSGERSYDIETLLEDAYEALAFDRIRAAFVAGERAAALALSDVNPLALEQARAVLAQVWVRSAELDPSSDDLLTAAWYTGLSGAIAPSRSESSALERLARLLRDHGTATLISQITVELTGAAVGRRQKAGVLRLLATMADLVPEGLLELVVHHVIVGLRRDWAVLKDVDQATAALQLARAIAPRLNDAHAREIRDELIAQLPSAGTRKRELVVTLGQYLEQVPLDDGPAEALTGELLPILDEGNERDHAAVRGCLGLMAVSAGPAVKDRLLELLAPSGGNADWRSRFWMWKAGRGPTSEEADEFLNEQAAVIEGALVRRAVEEHRTLFIVNDVSPTLAEAVAPHGTEEVRDRTLTLALQAAEHEELSRAERILWTDFAAHLAVASAALREPTVDVLTRIASGVSPDTRQIDPATHHRLSALRVQETPVAVAQGRALIALGRLHTVSPEPLRRHIERVFEQAIRHPQSDLREIAVREIGIAAENVASDADLSPLVQTCITLITDASANVRGAVYEALGRAAAAACASDETHAVIRRMLEQSVVEEGSAAARPFLDRAYGRLVADGWER